MKIILFLFFCLVPFTALSQDQPEPNEPSQPKKKTRTVVVHEDHTDKSKERLKGAILGALAVGLVWHYNKPKGSEGKEVEVGVQVRQ